MLAVSIVGGERSGRYVLSNPGGIAGTAVENGGCREGRVEIVDRAREAILKEAVGVDGGSYVVQGARIRGRWRRGRGRSGSV